MTPPSRHNRLLLFVEMELISISLSAILASILKHLHSLLHPSPFRFLFVFGAMSGVSTIILGIDFIVVLQKLRHLLLACRTMFHAPFIAAVVYGATLTFQGPLTTLSAAGQGVLVGFITTCTLAGVCTILDGFYNNMVLVLARDDEAGLLFLHHICRWIIAGVQLFKSSSQESRSGIELVQSLGNVHIWLLTALSQRTDQVQIPSEEEAALLGDHSDCTGSDELV